MKRKLEELKLHRDKLEKAKELFNIDYEEFTIAHQDLIQNIEDAKLAIIALTTEIKTEALLEYEKTGNIHLMGGVNIKLMQTLEYDKDVAFMWAKQHEMALLLDTKTFEKLAKVQNLDFVKSLEVPAATIPAKIE